MLNLETSAIIIMSSCFDSLSDLTHKFVRDIYNKRFPELEFLVPLPLEYVQTVKVCLSVATLLVRIKIVRKAV